MSDKQNRGWLGWTIVILIVAAAAAGGFWYFQRNRNQAPQYETTKVARGNVQQVVTATGALNPITNILVGCQVSGRISHLYANFNSRVKAGELIAQIDPRTYQAQVEQATADLQSAKANLELQQVEAKRAGDLFTNKLISGSDYDTAMATLHEAQANVQIKQAALNNAKANLEFCDIYSPVDGVVISRNVDMGQTVAASLNAPTLFEIANDLTRMQIDAAVDEADIGGIKEGQKVDFTVDAYPNRTFHGVVTQVRNNATNNNNVVTYDTVINVTNADLALKPGMTANVSIVVANRQNVLVIPNSALRFHPPTSALANASSGASTGRYSHRGGNAEAAAGAASPLRTVYVMKPNTTSEDPQLEPVKIKPGATDNIYTEVISGLQEGQEVVTGQAIPGLSSGQRTRNPFSPRHRF